MVVIIAITTMIVVLVMMVALAVPHLLHGDPKWPKIINL